MAQQELAEQGEPPLMAGRADEQTSALTALLPLVPRARRPTAAWLALSLSLSLSLSFSRPLLSVCLSVCLSV
eukprot:SAG25_NODE_384_length_8785_cov_7.011628_19_plen_71_part_01